ncbi:MAG: ADP-ribosylglycohydrolase family protein [Solobacterium sp.]|nr:ADP-ribosylglycohydrolase family protein [Solobacterium sp.]
MIGAIIGDIAGSRFERANHKSKEFELFDKKCRLTDDSIMSLAIANAILGCEGNFENLSLKAIENMQALGRKYKNAGFGSKFNKWIFADDPQPYNSFGNGSAMRVGPCGYAASSVDEVKELSAMVTQVSHNHPEGMKGAEAIAVAVYLAKNGLNKELIKTYIRMNYYEIDFTLDQIRKKYKFDATCQGSVPVALEAFYESSDFEDAIRGAISVGGDSDTIAAMTGVIAEAYYGIPEGIISSAIEYLDSEQMEILYYFEKEYPSKALDENGEVTRTVFEVLDDAVDKVIPLGTTLETDGNTSSSVIIEWNDKDKLVPDFSSFDKEEKGENARGLLSVASIGIQKTAKKAGKGILSTTKSVKVTLDQVKDMITAKTENCYALTMENSENTEILMVALNTLKQAGYDARCEVLNGNMCGYVFMKGENYDKAAELIESLSGITIAINPVDKFEADKIKKRTSGGVADAI